FMFFFSSRRRHTRFSRDWSSDVWSSDLVFRPVGLFVRGEGPASRGRRPQENLKNSRRGNMNDNIRQYARAARLALAAALGLALRSEERRVGREGRGGGGAVCRRGEWGGE